MAKELVFLGEGRVFAARDRSESESWAGPVVESLGTLKKSLRGTAATGSERADLKDVEINSDIAGRLSLLPDVVWLLIRSDKLGFFFSSLLVAAAFFIKVRLVNPLMGFDELGEPAPFTKSDKLNWELFLPEGTEKL